MKKEFDFVEFWAQKCRQDMASCQKEVNRFNDAQIKIANDFYKRLAKTKSGREKILELKRINAPI